MDSTVAPFCQPGDSDAIIREVFRERFATVPLGRWATDWSGTMDPFEGLWFRADGTLVHATQPGCDYEEVGFSWQPVGKQQIRLHFPTLPGEEDQEEEDESFLLDYDFSVRRLQGQVDVLLISRSPGATYLPWGFRFLDWSLYYVGGPGEFDEPVRWSLWGGIRYFG